MKHTCVCRAFVLENQGLVTFAFNKPDRFPVSEGGTKMLMHRVRANMRTGAGLQRAVTICTWPRQPAQMWRKISGHS